MKILNFAIFEKKYKDFRNNSFLKVGEGPFKYTIMQILTLGHDTCLVTKDTWDNLWSKN